MSSYPEKKPGADITNIYAWPISMPDIDESDNVDRDFYPFAFAVKDELEPVYESMWQPLPDDPVLLDEKITQEIEGWMPRVGALMVRAEHYLARAKKAKWPSKFQTADGKLATEGDRTAIYYDALADFRFLRDELENLLNRMDDRMQWGRSVRRQNANAQ